ncbi:MAG: acyl carrier protein [Prevotella sp.]|jgi:acyl carrier protein|nr:acyl carrier protein [Prevotella sp.]
MERKEVLEILRDILTKVLKRPGIQLDYGMSADDVEGWDSLTNMMIISETEKHFHIHFKMRDIIRMKTIGDMCDIIIQKQK